MNEDDPFLNKEGEKLKKFLLRNYYSNQLSRIPKLNNNDLDKKLRDML